MMLTSERSGRGTGKTLALVVDSPLCFCRLLKLGRLRESSSNNKFTNVSRHTAVLCLQLLLAAWEGLFSQNKRYGRAPTKHVFSGFKAKQTLR